MGAGTERTAQERTLGEPGPGADLCAAAAVYREEPHGRQGRHFHKSRQRDTRNEESHERDLEGGHNVLRLRHKGEPRECSVCVRSICFTDGRVCVIFASEVARIITRIWTIRGYSRSFMIGIGLWYL